MLGFGNDCERRRLPMDDTKLSVWGSRICWGAFAILMVYVCWATFSGTGVPGMVHRFIATVGMTSPKWPIAILFFPTLFVAYSAGALFDFATKQGLFASKPNETYQLNS